MAKDYSKTLNLPSTKFEMRANLPTKEPGIYKYWEDIDLYGKLMAKGEGKPSFIFHDGPPYANASIHLGLFPVLPDLLACWCRWA